MKKHFFSLRERGLFLLLLGLFLSFSSYAQDITVKGVVKDSKFGDPIIGASVLVKGTTNGTIGSPDKPGGLSIQLCKSEKKEFYIRYSS